MVVSDHQPLVSLKNNKKRQGPAMVERHKLCVQHFNVKVEYRHGSNNPTDYNIPFQTFQKKMMLRFTLTSTLVMTCQILSP